LKLLHFLSTWSRRGARAFEHLYAWPARRILNLAHELETRALLPDEEDIRTRAYDLWRKAGEPENRDEEFWLLAEQELRK
jgi:hypothetical protein